MGVTDGFQYYDPNGIEVGFTTVRNLCKENIHRKYYDLKCIPFNKLMNNEFSIHVRFVGILGEFNAYDEVSEKCEEALKNLFRYLNIINVQYGWVETKLQKPVYC